MAAPSAAHAGSDSMQPAGTGTWHGPAPRGWQAPRHASDPQPAAAAGAAAPAADEPRLSVLPSGDRMPMIGLGTFNIKSADTIKCAPPPRRAAPRPRPAFLPRALRPSIAS